MRAIKRYFAQWGIRESKFYKNKLNKQRKFYEDKLDKQREFYKVLDNAVADYKNLESHLRREIFHNTRRIRFLNAHNDTLTNELNEVKRAAEQTKEVALYFRDRMQEANSTVLIFKYSIDEFLKRHPEFSAEFDEIIKKESESEDED